MKQVYPSKRHALTILATIVLIAAIVSYYLLFGTHGVMNYHINGAIKAKHLNLAWIVCITLRYGLGILRDAGLLWALTWLAHRKLKVSAALQYWLLAALGGGLILLFVIGVAGPVWAGDVFAQLFFVTHGTMWPLAGMFWLILLQPWLTKLTANPWFEKIWWLLLSLPLLFNKDLFGFASGSNLLAMLMLGAGAIMLTHTRHRYFPSIGIIIPAIVLTGLVGMFEISAGLDLTNATRFIGLMSPLTLLPAIAMVQWLHQHASGHHLSLRFAILLSLTLMSAGSYPYFLANNFSYLKQLFASLGMLWLVPAVLWYTAATLIASAIAWLIAPRLTYWHQAARIWSVSFESALTHLSSWRLMIKHFWQRHWQILVVAISLILTQVLSALSMNQSMLTTENIWAPHLNIITFTITQMESRQLAGVLILLAAYWVLVGLTDRRWLSLLTVVSVSTIFAIANVVKIRLRSEPIMAADLAELGQISELSTMVSSKLLIGAGIGLVVIIGLIIYLEHRAGRLHQRLWIRGVKFGFSLIFLLSLGQLNANYSLTRNVLTSLKVDEDNNNPIRYAQWNGPILQFVSGLDVQAIAKPAGYSQAMIQKIVSKYQKRATQINQTRQYTTKQATVIFNLSESFADPTRIPGLSFNQDPMPYIRNLKKQTTSGYMMSFGVGGGTADMEYMTLTGMSLGAYDTALNTPYTQLVPKLATAVNIGDDFNYKSALHPYTGGFYNRPAVYKKFQFNKFAYLGSQYKIYDQKKLGRSTYLSDTTAYDNALHQINAKQNGQFINLISIQNHLPYNNWYPDNPFKATTSNGTLSAEKSKLETYAQGVNYTDQAVKAFKASLDKINKPIVWVFYGDHLPSLYPELADGVLNHQTDYFIYSNKYAREHGATAKLPNNQYVGPDNFIALAYQQLGVKVDAYDALLTDIQQQLPAQWIKTANSRTDSTTGVRFIDDGGNSVTYRKLSTKQKQLYHDYQMILYDLNVGDQYALKAGLEK